MPNFESPVNLASPSLFVLAVAVMTFLFPEITTNLMALFASALKLSSMRTTLNSSLLITVFSTIICGLFLFETFTLNVAFDGQIVNISKRNAVIPHIESADISGITLGSKVFTVPDKCPCCGEPTNIVTDSNSGVETLVCTNNKCSGRLLKKFSAFVSRSAMNIDGMSEKTLEKFT